MFDPYVGSSHPAAGYSDWHLDIHTPSNSVIFPGPEHIDGDLAEFAMRFADAVCTSPDFKGDNRFMVAIEGLRYRLQKLTPYIFAARLVASGVPRLNELGFPQRTLDLLLSEELRRTGGMVLFSGAPGAGKTTSAAATISARLKKMGGFCLTIEDPPEYELSGWHGENGYCVQMETTQLTYQDKLSYALSGFPSKGRSMLFFGEVRTPEAAAELLRISVDGHLVFSTIHSMDVIRAVQRLLVLGSAEGEDNGRFLLSASLKLVVHQRLDTGKLQQLAFPISESGASIIQRGNVGMLNDELTRYQQAQHVKREAEVAAARR